MRGVLRWFNPNLEPAAVGAATAAVYAAVVMFLRWRAGDGVIEPDVVVAAVWAVHGVFTRAKATPLADPRDGKGRPLTPPVPAPRG